MLVHRGLIDQTHRFFDGPPATAHATINPYRDEIYEESLETIEARLEQTPSETVSLSPEGHSSPVELEKTTYPVDQSGVKTRRGQPMKPVADRQSAGDPAAHFQRGKHGKRSELGYDIFFTTDSKQLFIEAVDVSAAASQGQTIFTEKLEQSDPGQEWSVDAEFSTGPLLETAEEKEVILNTPPRADATTGRFAQRDVVSQPESDTYTCPHQQTLSYVSITQKTEAKTYRPAKGTWAACPLREQCTTSKTERSVTRSHYEEAFDRQRAHAKTPQAVMGRVLWGIIAEGKFAEAVRHGLKQMRYVGKTLAVMQSKLVATMLHVKRLIRLEQAGALA